MTLCKDCGRPPTTRGTDGLDNGRIIPGALHCEQGRPGCAPKPEASAIRANASPLQDLCLDALRAGCATVAEVAEKIEFAKSKVATKLAALAADGTLTRKRYGNTYGYWFPGTPSPMDRIAREDSMRRANHKHPDWADLDLKARPDSQARAERYVDGNAEARAKYATMRGGKRVPVERQIRG